MLLNILLLGPARSGLEESDGIKPSLAGCRQQYVFLLLLSNVCFAKPYKADLDVERLLRGKYIMLDRVDVHCIWVSQAILSLLPDPPPIVPGGEIITDPGKGVFCDNAMDLVMQRWPQPGKEKKTEFVTSAIQRLHEVGLVGMHDAGVTPKNLDLFQEMADGEAWSMRVYAMFECERRNTFCPEEAEQYVSNDGMLQVRSVKLFAGSPSFSFALPIQAIADIYARRWCIGFLG
jgi:predicted amidohydrolase YtcJ